MKKIKFNNVPINISFRRMPVAIFNFQAIARNSLVEQATLPLTRGHYRLSLSFL